MVCWQQITLLDKTPSQQVSQLINEWEKDLGRRINNLQQVTGLNNGHSYDEHTVTREVFFFFWIKVDWAVAVGAASEPWTESVLFHWDSAEQTLQVGDIWSAVNQLTQQTDRRPACIQSDLLLNVSRSILTLPQEHKPHVCKVGLCARCLLHSSLVFSTTEPWIKIHVTGQNIILFKC